jgi:HK97 family phage portal protein
MLPALTEAIREFRRGLGSMPEPLHIGELKGESFGTVVNTEWYQREGYYGIARALGGGGSEYALSAFYGGLKIIAEDMGSMSFQMNERSKDRSAVNPAVGHPLFQTLRNLVNPDLSSGEFVEMLTAHALAGGDGLAEIQRQGDSVFLWPWMPGETRVDSTNRGRTVYIRKEGNLQEKTYERSRVFHLRGFTLGGTCGDDLVRRARRSLGLAGSMEQYAANYFENDATPGVVILRPKEATPLSPDGIKNFKTQWAEWHRGVARSHEPAVIQEGMTIDKLRSTATEAQLKEQREFAVIETCRWLRLSPHKLADLSRSTYSNIEHLEIEHVTHTLAAWISRWSRAVHRCLLTTDEQQADRLFAEHDVSSLLRGDFGTQSEGFRKLLEKGVYSINEVRKWIRMNPIDGGDDHFVQMNLAPVQDVAAGLTLRKVEPQPAAGAQQ